MLLDSALFDGSPSQIPLGVLSPTTSTDVEIGVCFVDDGIFDFRALLEEVGKGPVAGLDVGITIYVKSD